MKSGEENRVIDFYYKYSWLIFIFLIVIAFVVYFRFMYEEPTNEVYLGNLNMSFNYNSTPTKVVFVMDEVQFIDKTLNLTWTSKVNATNGFMFDFKDFDIIEWNIDNETYVYEKVEENK